MAARNTHPDRNLDNIQNAVQNFQRVQTAYQSLMELLQVQEAQEAQRHAQKAQQQAQQQARRKQATQQARRQQATQQARRQQARRQQAHEQAGRQQAGHEQTAQQPPSEQAAQEAARRCGVVRVVKTFVKESDHKELEAIQEQCLSHQIDRNQFWKKLRTVAGGQAMRKTAAKFSELQAQRQLINLLKNFVKKSEYSQLEALGYQSICSRMDKTRLWEKVHRVVGDDIMREINALRQRAQQQHQQQ